MFNRKTDGARHGDALVAPVSLSGSILGLALAAYRQGEGCEQK